MKVCIRNLYIVIVCCDDYFTRACFEQFSGKYKWDLSWGNFLAESEKVGVYYYKVLQYFQTTIL